MPGADANTGRTKDSPRQNAYSPWEDYTIRGWRALIIGNALSSHLGQTMTVLWLQVADHSGRVFAERM
jgi:hypothetical protein